MSCLLRNIQEKNKEPGFGEMTSFRDSYLLFRSKESRLKALMIPGNIE